MKLGVVLQHGDEVKQSMWIAFISFAYKWFYLLIMNLSSRYGPCLGRAVVDCCILKYVFSSWVLERLHTI